jgi:hypothetical protein
VAEPLFGASKISLGWSLGFVLLIPLIALCGMAAMRGGAEPTQTTPGAGTDDRVSLAQLGRWAYLAFLPSSLMLCVTTRISTDIGSFPLV